MADRVVRFATQFFDRLDELLPAERSPDGAPSAADFLLYDLPRIRDQLAADFEANTLPADDEPVRVWVGSGVVVENVALSPTSLTMAASRSSRSSSADEVLRDDPHRQLAVRSGIVNGTSARRRRWRNTGGSGGLAMWSSSG